MFTRGFMLDTSAINRIHDSEECEWSLRGPLYVTEIQLQEIVQTRRPERRNSLLEVFFSLRLTILRPLGLGFDPEFFGFTSYCTDGSTLAAEDLDHPRGIGRIMPYIAASLGGRIEKQFPDGLIAERALWENLTLVTADRKLAKVARTFGAYVEEIP